MKKNNEKNKDKTGSWLISSVVTGDMLSALGGCHSLWGCFIAKISLKMNIGLSGYTAKH